MSIRRVNKELKTAPLELDNEGHGIALSKLQDDNIMDQEWIICPDGGAYKDHTIKVNVKIPSEYPFKHPTIRLWKNIFHPNVTDHEMCLGTINEWHPKSTIHDIMKEIHGLLMCPNLDTALCTEAMEVFKSSLKVYTERALKSMM